MKTILVADDKHTSRELVRVVLGKEGHRIVEAADGQEALDLIREHRPDLVLLDLHMPKLDGFGVVRELRRDPELQSLPVVAITASAMQGDREKALQAGFNAYCTKPLSLTALREQVAGLLGVA